MQKLYLQNAIGKLNYVIENIDYKIKKSNNENEINNAIAAKDRSQYCIKYLQIVCEALNILETNGITLKNLPDPTSEDFLTRKQETENLMMALGSLIENQNSNVSNKAKLIYLNNMVQQLDCYTKDFNIAEQNIQNENKINERIKFEASCAVAKYIEKTRWFSDKTAGVLTGAAIVTVTEGPLVCVIALIKATAQNTPTLQPVFMLGFAIASCVYTSLVMYCSVDYCENKKYSI